MRHNRAAATAWAGAEPAGGLHNPRCRQQGAEGLGGGGGGKGARGGEGALTIRPGMPLRDGTGRDGSSAPPRAADTRRPSGQ